MKRFDSYEEAIGKLRREWIESVYESHMPPTIVKLFKTHRHRKFLKRYLDKIKFELRLYHDGKLVATLDNKIIGIFENRPK